ncbi:MAG: carbohydrate porin, partial [Planctomycetota bacterium]
IGGGTPKEVNAAMYRHCTKVLTALCALGLVWAAPTWADDSAEIQREIDKLKSELDVLAHQDNAEVDSEIEDFLDRSNSFAGAQGDDAWSKIRIGAEVLIVNQNTLAHDPSNVSTVNGNVRLNTLFQATEALHIFADLIAQTDGALPNLFPPDSGGFFGARTFAGEDDGIGLNGSVQPRPTGGVQVLEAGIRYFREYSKFTIGMELGLIDPRERYLQNTFMRDERTQFLNNQFDDESSISWATNADFVPDILGAHFWIPFGQEKQFTVRVGWFNEAGRWFDKGQLYFEFQWSGTVKGGAMNFVITGVLDSFTDRNVGGEMDTQWGASWDWQFSERWGFFARIAGNTEDVASVETSASFGAIYQGVGSRPDDQIGLGVYYLKANNNVMIGLLDDSEWACELYYKWMVADGRMEITPNLMFVSDPGGGGLAWEDDTLWILGVRFYVPF